MEDINKREETFRQIDEQVPEKMEFQNPIVAIEKELDDTRAYLDIVLKELEEAKKVKPQVNKPKRNIWKALVLLETVFVISGCVIFAIYSKNQQSIPTMSAQEDQIEEVPIEDTVVPVIETTRLCENLDSLIADYRKETSEFIPSVVKLFGYEYLMLSNGKIDVYYRNEIPIDSTNYRQKIMIDNGKKISEFNWDYDLTKGIEALCPKFGEFFGNSEKQLIFTIYDENFSMTMPTQLRAVSAKNLWEHDIFDVEAAINSLFTPAYEEVGNDVNDPDMRMKLSFGSTLYTYAIEKEEYINAVFYEEDIIKHEQHFSLIFEDNAIKITSIPYLSDNRYLGEFSATIGLSNNELKLKDSTFGAYVEANQEDLDKEGVIVPRTEILSEDRIKLWGFNGEVFLLELSEIVERSTITQEDLIADEDGFLSYQNGEVRSIPGIDVSKFQGKIDWDKVKAAGVEFAIIRVGFRGYNEGTLELDPYFEENIKGATESGIHVGVYFFSQAITVEEAKEEAQFVLDKIEGYKVTYPVIIDTEHVTTYPARANSLSRQLRTDIAKVFCEEVKAYGYKPMIYANTKWMVMGIDLEQLSDYDLWFAYYGNNLSFPYQYDILQYSDTGKIDGINHAVDLNISFKDYSK